MAVQWLEKTKYFDLTIDRETATEELQFKAIIELLFMMNMLCPNSLFKNKMNQKTLFLKK